MMMKTKMMRKILSKKSGRTMVVKMKTSKKKRMKVQVKGLAMLRLRRT